MSIAAENAGLGPCDLPLSEQWIPHTQLSQSPQSSQYSSSQSGQSLGLVLQHQQQHSSSLANQQQSSHLQSQSKIMNAIVSPVVCPPTATKKIRRKTDSKKYTLQPQSQINKCNNEKRRRELENEYIEQLGEFLHINKRDMTACKPDKAAILSEVVRTFRRLLEQGNHREISTRCTNCPPDCTDSCTLHPVQQGEVSSTEPPLPEPSVNGHSPEKSAYFEAVQHYISNIGWALLEINSEGNIECATENVLDVLHYSRSELNGQSIYSYLHTGDHAKLSPILDKNTLSLDWDQDDGQMFLQTPPKRTIRTKIRWLLKAPEGASETIEQKQQRQDRYKDLLIISAPVKDDTETESSSVLCLITLPEDEQTLQEGSMPQQLEQLTIKVDISGKIIDINASNAFANAITKDTVRTIHDLCHVQDRNRLQEHLNNVVNSNGSAQMTTYRLRLGGQDNYVPVKAQSRLFRSKQPNESDFIMAVHTILSNNELAMIESQDGSGALGNMPGTSNARMGQMHHQTSGGNMGGPLMTSIMNGGSGGTVTIANNLGSIVSPRPSMLHSDSSAYNLDSLIDFDFPHSTYNLDPVVDWDTRPDSRTSVTPVSTPRPPSVTAYSPAQPNMCPSPLTPYHSGGGSNSVGQPSPSNNNNNNANNNNNNNNTNNNNTNTGNFGTNFSYNFEDNKEKIQEQIQQMSAPSDSERLRNLLTTKRPSSSAGLESGGSSGSEQDQRNANRILKLLNEKSDDDDPENKSRSGHSELLRQLQKVKEEPMEHKPNPPIGNEELIQRLRLQTQKRPSNEPDEGSAAKRTDDKPSKLREKNKMLASLLANPSKAPTTILPHNLPINRIIPDIPNNRNLIVNLPANNNNNTSTMNNNLKQVQQQIRAQQSMRKGQTQQQQSQPQQMPQNASEIYLSQQQLLQQHQGLGPDRQHFQGAIQDSGIGSVGSGPYATSASATSTQPPTDHFEDDQELHDIIEEIIGTSDIPGIQMDTDLSSIGSMGFQPNQSTQTHPDLQEKLAINAIQKSLMQIESGVTSPLQQYDTSPPAYPLHGLQQSPNVPTTSNSNFPPPPVYAQRQARMPQQANSVTLQRLQYQRMLQQQHKERLLQQQQKQQMVVPVNATAGADQLCLNQGIQNIESLLNNTVAPNVSLTRSSGVNNDSQLSPGFAQTLIQQQLSPNQRNQFSPQQQIGCYQQQQNIAGNFPQTNTNNQQLSPRQPPFNANQINAQSQQQQVHSLSTANERSIAQWQQQNANARISIQQQNPMLNAQLSTVAGYNQNSGVGNRQFVTPQRQRSLNSPGTPVSRQNSFGSAQDGGFPGPPSPSPSQQQQAATTTYGSSVFANSQMRLQRQASVPPQATQHLPGSPRPFGPGAGPDASGYSMMYGSMQHSTSSPGDYYSRAQTGANNNINSSEYVRQELRAVVSGRSQGGGSGGGTPTGSSGSNNISMNDTSQLPPSLNTPPEMDPSMRFNFDMNPDFFGGNTSR